MKKDIINGIVMSIMTIVLMVIILPKTDKISHNLTIILGCVCVMTISSYFLSKEMTKILEKGFCLILIPSFIMLVSEFKPEILQLNILYIYLFVTLNIVINYCLEKISKRFLKKKVSKLDTTFFKSLY